MIGKVLLGSTALAGIAVCALPVSAGQLGSRDSLQVTLRGELRFSTGFSDQDVSATSGRGYTFRVDESEIRMIARNNAENGLEYGVSIELLTGAGDSAGADEAFAFVDSEAWGRVEMGDQDDAFDRMHVAAHDILVGRAGADGDPGDFFAFGTGDAIDSPGVDSTSDDTKITYFTPRVAGFQFGSSLTPDSGQTSGGNATADSDSDGDFENVFSVAANYKEKFDDLAIAVSLGGEFGDSETRTGAATEGKIKTFAVGANMALAGFGLGASFADFAEKGISAADRSLGGDAGAYYSLGASYRTGPWGVSLGWFESSVTNPSGSGAHTDVTILSLDAAYDVAPGWELMGSLHFADASNINATPAEVGNEGTVFVISNEFKF